MSFIEARLVAQGVPRAREVPVATGQSFEVGALGSLVAGEFTEASADPAVGAVTFVSQTPFGAGTTGFGEIAGRREFPAGKAVVTDAFATTFRCEYTGTLPASSGGSYGVVRGADGKWRVNFADTVAPLQVRYIGRVSDLPPGVVPRLVEVEFIAA
jgi:hypothetical protein